MLQPGVKKSILEYFGVVLTMFGLGSVILVVRRLTFYHVQPGLEIRKFSSECQKAPRLYKSPDNIFLQTIKPPCCISPNSKKLTLGKRVLNADKTALLWLVAPCHLFGQNCLRFVNFHSLNWTRVKIVKILVNRSQPIHQRSRQVKIVKIVKSRQGNTSHPREWQHPHPREWKSRK